MISKVPAEIIVIFAGALPIAEVRGAIPLGMLFFGFPAWKAWLLAVIGNLLPIVPLWYLLNAILSGAMHRWYVVNRFFSWLFDYTRERHGDHFHSYRWAPLALFLFVAIPLPMTGAWSAMIAALIFGMSFRDSILATVAGILASGGIVTALVSLGIMVFNRI
jgi:uncharacterized membrane protein